MVSVNVKWGKEKYDIDVDLKDEPITFKSQLFALTGVEPGRQRVMYKGKTLRDESWEGFPDLVAGANLMMMGSASALPEAPKEKVKFLEDMSENELARNLDIPAGLKNLGNTCYLNATLQCLKTVPELRDSLKSFRGQALNIGEGSEAITASVRDLFGQMDKSKECVPLIMVQVLHMIFPRFAEKDDHGHWSQQDANECWVELVRMLQQKLKSPTPVDTTPTSSASGGSGRSVVDEYMRGVSSVTMKCLENPDEPEVKTSEDFFSLSCFLAQEVKYLHSGLTARITEEIEKRSEALNRNAKYEKKQLISRLPGYLTIQMIRFYFKEKDAINAKILKDIKFTMQLDVYELCAPELQAKLMPMRDRFKAEDDRIAAGKKDGKAAVEAVGEAVPWSFPEDRGSNNSGFYQLQAILTHKGRSSNSGHYVAWVRRPNGDWIMCDDEHVTKISEEDVMKLSGGGDWHCAYILLYGPRILHEEAPESSASDPPRMDVDA